MRDSTTNTEHHQQFAFSMQWYYDTLPPPLVAGGARVRGRREAQAGVGGVIDGVEPLEERIPVDEVQALARVAANVGDDEVDVASAAADRGVQRARPDLRVRREAVGRLQNGCQRKDGGEEGQDARRRS